MTPQVPAGATLKYADPGELGAGTAWEPLASLVGPRGPQGPPGDRVDYRREVGFVEIGGQSTPAAHVDDTPFFLDCYLITTRSTPDSCLYICHTHTGAFRFRRTGTFFLTAHLSFSEAVTGAGAIDFLFTDDNTGAQVQGGGVQFPAGATAATLSSIIYGRAHWDGKIRARIKAGAALKTAVLVRAVQLSAEVP